VDGVLDNWLDRFGDFVGGFLTDSLSFVAGFAIVVAVIVVTTWLGTRARIWFVRRSAHRLGRVSAAGPLIDNLFRVGVFVLGIFLAMGVVGASPSSLVTWIGVIVAALSLAVQDVIKNLVAGFYLLIEQPFAIGDWLDVGGQAGAVERVDLRITMLRNNRRELVLVPNYIVFSQAARTRPALRPHCLELVAAQITEPPETIAGSVALAVRSALGENAERPVVELRATTGRTCEVLIRAWMDDPATEREKIVLAVHRRYPEATVSLAPP